VSRFVRIYPFYLDYQIFLDGLEHTAGPGSESFTPHCGLTQHISSYILLSEAVTTDSIAPGYGRFSDSLLQRQRFISCVSDRLLLRDALTARQCPYRHDPTLFP
jgi:hypothetical protein